MEPYFKLVVVDDDEVAKVKHDVAPANTCTNNTDSLDKADLLCSISLQYKKKRKDMWITILPCNPSKQERALAASEILVEFVPCALLPSHRASPMIHPRTGNMLGIPAPPCADRWCTDSCSREGKHTETQYFTWFGKSPTSTGESLYY